MAIIIIIIISLNSSLNCYSIFVTFFCRIHSVHPVQLGKCISYKQRRTLTPRISPDLRAKMKEKGLKKTISHHQIYKLSGWTRFEPRDHITPNGHSFLSLSPFLPFPHFSFATIHFPICTETRMYNFAGA